MKTTTALGTHGGRLVGVTIDKHSPVRPDVRWVSVDNPGEPSKGPRVLGLAADGTVFVPGFPPDMDPVVNRLIAKSEFEAQAFVCDGQMYVDASWLLEEIPNPVWLALASFVWHHFEVKHEWLPPPQRKERWLQ
jgi:hypothetical protein